jgi:hypothetical protein
VTGNGGNGAQGCVIVIYTVASPVSANTGAFFRLLWP